MRRERERTERERDRGRGDSRRTARETGSGGQSEIMFVEFKQKKAAAAKHVYELVYMSEKQHRERKKLTNETRDFEPMQSAALPCVSTVVNL